MATAYLNRLNLNIQKNPESELHAACSCLPTWLLCDHLKPKDTKRTQEADDLTATESGVIAPGNVSGFHLLDFDCFSPVRGQFIYPGYLTHLKCYEKKKAPPIDIRTCPIKGRGAFSPLFYHVDVCAVHPRLLRSGFTTAV